MKLRSTLLLLLLAALIGGATYAYRTNATVKGILDEYVLGQEEPKIELPKPVPLAVFEVGDPTDIDDRQYAIPLIDTAHVGRVLDLLFNGAGGRYWLTHLDRRSADNPVHYLEVPARFAAYTTITRDGQNTYSWERVQKEHQAKHTQWKSDSLVNEAAYRALRARFLIEAESYLSGTVYVHGSPEHRGTDAIGTLNPAFRSLGVEDAGHAKEKKFIVMFGDGEHNVRTGEALLERPTDITIAVVNPRPGATKKVITDVVEVDHPDRVLRLLEQASRPATHNSIATNSPQ